MINPENVFVSALREKGVPESDIASYREEWLKACAGAKVTPLQAQLDAMAYCEKSGLRN